MVFNHLLNDRHDIVAQQDDRPQHGQPLMTCWQPGEIYHDQQVLDVKPDLPAGAYSLEMGLYDARTGARVPVVTADGQVADHFTIAPVDLQSGLIPR